MCGVNLAFMDGKNSKLGQTSFEFIVTIVVLLVVALGLLVFLQLNALYISEKNAYDSMENVAKNFAIIFENAALLKSGFKNEVDFSQIVGQEYSVDFLNGTAVLVRDTSGRTYIQYLSLRSQFVDRSCQNGQGKHTLRKEYDQLVVCCGQCDDVPLVYCQKDGLISRCQKEKHSFGNVSLVVECPYYDMVPGYIDSISIINISSSSNVNLEVSQFSLYDFVYLNKTSYVQNTQMRFSSDTFVLNFECEDGTTGPYDYSHVLFFG
jgi:hypothetical protein